jgi:hypothetical protein
MATEVERVCGRYILIKNANEISVGRSECICDADKVIFEFQCPKTTCSLARREIDDIINECSVHKPVSQFMMCGGSVEMCKKCINEGYSATDGTGGGLMVIYKDDKIVEEYCPILVKNPHIIY